MKIEPILGVKNVQKSSEWYQEVFNLTSGHGGDTFEMLNDKDGQTILCLHVWGEHEHPTIHKSNHSNGNGLILYFKVDDLKMIWQKVNATNTKIEFEPTLNENSGKTEFAIRDLDGYYLLVSKKRR